jgi:serine/threonine protein phosphatase PrpC
MAQVPPRTGACPTCHEPVAGGDNFCESCGTELAPASVSGGGPEVSRVCGSCQSGRTGRDGRCESCGRHAPYCLDHQELDLGLLAGVTDRGLRHHRNEDVMALATAESGTGPVAVAVVCDGVSTSDRPDEASQAAAQAAARVLLDAVRTGEDPPAASVAAVRSARHAVADLASPSGAVPSSTYISAVMTRTAVTLCWLGDTRGYWLGDTPGPGPAAHQLTRDDSLAEELVAAGLLAQSDADTSPHVHVLTRWVGADTDASEPHVTTFEPPGRGALLLCSDGLWNYQPDAAKLAEMALPTALTDPLGAAGTLVNFALDAGGMDNVTVVLVPFPPTRRVRSSPVPAAAPARPPDATPAHPRRAQTTGSGGSRPNIGDAYR